MEHGTADSLKNNCADPKKSSTDKFSFACQLLVVLLHCFVQCCSDIPAESIMHAFLNR